MRSVREMQELRIGMIPIYEGLPGFIASLSGVPSSKLPMARVDSSAVNITGLKEAIDSVRQVSGSYGNLSLNEE